MLPNVLVAAKSDIMPLVSVVLGPQNAHSRGAPQLRDPHLQGGCVPVGCSWAAVKLAAGEGSVFPLQKGVSPLPPQLGLSFVAGVPLIQISVLSQG